MRCETRDMRGERKAASPCSMFKIPCFRFQSFRVSRFPASATTFAKATVVNESFGGRGEGATLRYFRISKVQDHVKRYYFVKNHYICMICPAIMDIDYKNDSN